MCVCVFVVCGVCGVVCVYVLCVCTEKQTLIPSANGFKIQESCALRKV